MFIKNFKKLIRINMKIIKNHELRKNKKRLDYSFISKVRTISMNLETIPLTVLSSNM